MPSTVVLVVTYEEPGRDGEVRVQPDVLQAVASRLGEISDGLRRASRAAQDAGTQAATVAAADQTSYWMRRVIVAWEQADEVFEQDLEHLADGLWKTAGHYRDADHAVVGDFAVLWS